MKRHTYFDANTWIGRYPFSHQPAHTPATLVAHLRSHGITRALVSHTDAIFAPDPTPANEHLNLYTRTHPALIPVPIINPTLANWREQLDTATNDPRTRALRLLPAYHDYAHQPRALDALITETKTRNLRVIITARLIDERHEYHALNIKATPLATLDAILKRHATKDHPIHISGLLYAEINKLVPKHPHMLADLSFADWHDTIDALLAKHDARQLLYASHTPFLITAASTAKFDHIRTNVKTIAKITSQNLDDYFAP